MTTTRRPTRETLLLAAALHAFAGGLGCGSAADPPAGTTPTIEVPLVTADAWVLVEGDADPFQADRPEGATCTGGFQLESGVFEVETDLCAWGTFQQPLLTDVAAQTPLRIIAWHLPLWAPEPAEGVLILEVGGHRIWDLVIPIPHEAMLYNEEVLAPAELLHDDPVYLHVHNHGTNSWRFAVFHALVEE
jgi:hypothetical protein